MLLLSRATLFPSTVVPKASTTKPAWHNVTLSRPGKRQCVGHYTQNENKKKKPNASQDRLLWLCRVVALKNIYCKSFPSFKLAAGGKPHLGSVLYFVTHQVSNTSVLGGSQGHLVRSMWANHWEPRLRTKWTQLILYNRMGTNLYLSTS